MREKRAQGLPVNVIIIAVLALIVLVVLLAIFGVRLGLWGKGVKRVIEVRCPGKAYTSFLGCDEVIYGDFEELRGRPDIVCCTPCSVHGGQCTTKKECEKRKGKIIDYGCPGKLDESDPKALKVTKSDKICCKK